MAITTQERSNILKLVVGMFDAAPGAAYLNEFVGAYQALGNSYEALATALGNTGAFQTLYSNALTNEEKSTKFLKTLGLDGNAEAQEWVVAKLNAGEAMSSVILQALVAIIETTSPDFADAQALLNNKAAVAEYYSVTLGKSADDLGTLQGVVANVKADSDVSTPEAMDNLIGGSNGDQTELTLGKDKIVATKAGQTFTAGLEQAGMIGNVSNTFESGDSIIGKGDGNTLKVDLTHTVSGTIPVGPAISASTQNIQVVEFREQAQQVDTGGVGHAFLGNGSTIDAEKMLGVKEWWSVNSRSGIQIEDVRSRPEDTTIGMRDTDPEVSFRVYFDPEQIKGGENVKTALTLSLTRISDPAAELGDTSIEGVSFKLAGQTYVLTSEAIAAAKTYAAWRDALEAAAKTIPALAGVSFVLNPDNSVTLIDADGREFEKGNWQFVGNQVPPDGDLVWKQVIGVPEREDVLVNTNIKLDNVGRTSQGGILDVGSLGDGGVQVFNVEVQRDSWLTAMNSSDHLGDANVITGFGPNIFLEEVYLTNKEGSKGNLTLGSAIHVNDVRHPDNRVDTWGLTDVRKFDASAFKGQVNLGAQLTDDSVVRYLDGATEPVKFEYTMSAQNDILNLRVDGELAGDPDFALDVAMGAGDDRLILEVGDDVVAPWYPVLKNISVDGGTGANTIVVRSDVGMTAKNTFKSFQNFQTYEIEGGSSDHNFTHLNGVKTVIVATGGGATTMLRDLPADIAAVSVSGKNQTIGTANNANQTFADIDVQAAKAAELTVNLDNTARTTGKLTVNNLLVRDNQADLNDKSAVTKLNIVSNGVRNTANEIGSIQADGVSTFNLSGTQALAVQIDEAAKTLGNVNGYQNLVVDGSAAKGDLTVGIDAGAILNKLATQDKTMTFKGGEGTKDNLIFNGGAIAVMKALSTVSGFETVTFEDGGKYNAVNTSGVNLYHSYDGDALEVINLRGEENVKIGHKVGANTVVNTGGDQQFVTNALSAGSKINVDMVGSSGAAQQIDTAGYTTLALHLTEDKALTNGFKQFTLYTDTASYDGVADAWTNWTDGSDVDLTVVGNSVPVNHISRVALKSIVVTGGTGEVAGGAAVSTLDTGWVLSTVKLLDVSGYQGHMSAIIPAREVADVITATGTTTYDTGNTVIKVGQFGIDMQIEQAMYKGGALDATDGKVITFEFTKDALLNAATNNDFQWVIDGFQGVNGAATIAGAAAGGVNNLTVLDVSALGARTLADLKMVTVGGDLHITDNAGTHKYEIVLVGTNQVDLGIENFKFAA